MALLNYTSTVPSEKTAAEIAKILSKAGASAVMMEYDREDGHVTTLSFRLPVGDKHYSFKLPVDYHPVLAIITKGKKEPSNYDTKRHDVWAKSWREQAIRTSWRIIKDWVEAQCALIETQMVTTGQVFLPYLLTRSGQTLTEVVINDPKFLLE